MKLWELNKEFQFEIRVIHNCGVPLLSVKRYDNSDFHCQYNLGKETIGFAILDLHRYFPNSDFFNKLIKIAGL